MNPLIVGLCVWGTTMFLILFFWVRHCHHAVNALKDELNQQRIVSAGVRPYPE